MNIQVKPGYKIVETSFRKYVEIPEDWDSKLLGNLGTVLGGATPDSINDEYWNGEIPWAIPTDITNLEGSYIGKTSKNISKKGFNSSSINLLPKGSVLITSRATIGECAINTVPMTTNQGFQNLVCNDSTNNLFILYSIQLNKNQLIRFANGTTFLEINNSNMKKIKIPIPSLPEQEKIASILSNVDNHIQKISHIIKQTEKLKKGLMQELFTIGIGHKKFKKIKWRFRKEIEIPEEWEIQKLEDICVKITDGTHFSPINTSKGDFLYLTSKNLRPNGIDLSNVTFIDKKIHDEIYERCSPEKNDVLFVKDGVGTGLAVVNSLDYPFSMLSSIALFKLNKSKINYKFLTYFLNYEPIFQMIVGEMVGTAIKRVTLEILKKVNIIIPKINEQKKIASILSKVDDKILHFESKKTSLEQLKKGLMQKLLTGKIRVKF